MQKPLQITLHGLEHSAALDSLMRRKAAKLEEFHPGIIGCHITVNKPQHKRRHGGPFEVRIDVHLSGKGEVVVNQQHAEDVYVAVRDAFDAAKRQLEDQIRVLRGDVKTHPLPSHGHITQLFAEDGYGFIKTPDGRSVYFARENVVEPPFEHLHTGTEVQFLEEMAQEGAQAKRVTAGKHHFV